MMIFMRDKIRPANEQEKKYVKALSMDAIDETIETDGLTLYWDEPQSMARFSTQYPQRKED